MLFQEKRGILFLVTNAVLCLGFSVFGLLAGPAPDVEARAAWARLLLVYLGAQILLRLLVTILFAILHKIAVGEETVDVEDEMDRLIDLRATNTFFKVFVFGLVLSLVTQAVGLPLRVFFLGLGASMMVSGLVGDLRSVLLYRRGP